MSTCCVPDTVLGTRDAEVDRTDTDSACVWVGGVTGVIQEARDRHREVPGCGAVLDLGAPGAARLGSSVPRVLCGCIPLAQCCSLSGFLPLSLWSSSRCHLHLPGR